jgi:hypothetical protein
VASGTDLSEEATDVIGLEVSGFLMVKAKMPGFFTWTLATEPVESTAVGRSAHPISPSRWRWITILDLTPLAEERSFSVRSAVMVTGFRKEKDSRGSPCSVVTIKPKIVGVVVNPEGDCGVWSAAT